MHDEFYTFAEGIEPLLRGGEAYTCSFSAEESDFVRFTRGEVRQAGAVAQRFASLDLIDGRRHAKGTVALSGRPAEDQARLAYLIRELRDLRAQVGEDPYLLYATDVRSTERRQRAALPESRQAVEGVRAAAAGHDLVGIYAAGAVHTGFANSLGQRNWHTSESFNLDWSFFRAADKAVKSSYAGTAWRAAELGVKVEAALEQLQALGRPARRIAPGRYRAYLAPAALWELIGILGWGGFGLRAHRTKTTPLLKMIEEGARLSRSVRLVEDTANGVSADFQESGFIRPERVVLIEGGEYADCLVSPPSAVEYGVPTNGASSGEAPASVDMAGGDLPLERVLETLGTGIYINNLWYLNFSDRSACRATGMTRFATFWVEHGRIVAPLEVMRFDDTVYRMLGENLIGLTAEREFMLDAGSYSQRSTDSARLPGALVEDLTLTL
ncbi:MAG: metallopeptidase TldD-related protein [Candidatus Binatia bacterium]